MKTPCSAAACLIEPLETRIALTVDLAISIESITGPDVFVPGDKVSITYLIGNAGDEPFQSSHLDVNVWLSRLTTPIPHPVTSDIALHAKYRTVVDGKGDMAVSLAPGATVKKTVKFEMPDLVLTGGVDPNFVFGETPFNLSPGNDLHLVVELDPQFAVDPFLHDNNSAATAPIDWQFKFGAVGERPKVSLSATETDGTLVSFAINGPGTGEVQLHNFPTVGNDLVLTGTTEESFASAGIFKGGKFSDNRILMENITINGALKGLKMATADVTGNITATGALGGLQLGNVGGAGKSLTIGGTLGTSPATKVIFGEVNDLNVTAPAGLAVLEASVWRIGANPDTITTPFITDLSTTDGDFGASLNLAGGPSKDGELLAIKTADIAGALVSGIWTVTGDIGKIDATSIAPGWKLLGKKHPHTLGDRAATDVGKVIVSGGMGGLLEGSSFGKVEIFGDFTGRINAEPFDKFSPGLGSFKAGKVLGGADAGILSIAGVVSKISVQTWTGGSITGGNFGDIKFRGGGKTLPGNAQDLKITSTGGTSADGIGKLTAQGSLRDVEIDTAGGIVSSITAAEWVGGKLTTHVLGSLKLSGDKSRGLTGDLSNVKLFINDPVAKVAKIDIAGFVSSSTIQVMGNIGTLQALGMNFSTISAFGAIGIDKLATKGKEAGVLFFASTTVFATAIKTVVVSNVDESAGATNATISAGAIDKYARAKDGKLAKSLSALDETNSALDTVGRYQLLIN